MTLAVKVALNPNTNNQPIKLLSNVNFFYIFLDTLHRLWVDYDQLRADIEGFKEIPQQSFPCLLHDIKPVSKVGEMF